MRWTEKSYVTKINSHTEITGTGKINVNSEIFFNSDSSDGTRKNCVEKVNILSKDNGYQNNSQIDIIDMSSGIVSFKRFSALN